MNRDEKTMRVEIIEPLITVPVPRDTFAPWLDKRSHKVKLVQRFVVKIDDEYIVVPKGYVFDWSSIPRFFWIIYPPNFTEAREASCIHDYIYSHLYWYYSKKFADDAYRALMELNNASWFSTRAFHISVKIGGSGGWKQKDREKSHPHWKIKHEKFNYHSSDPVLDETFVTHTAD